MLINYFDQSKDVKLKSVKLVEEEKQYGYRHFYLDVTYTYIDKEGNKHEINFPKIELPIRENVLPTINSEICSDRRLFTSNNTIDIGFGELNIRRDSENIYAKDRIVEYCYKEMTIEEIQSKLGYKIKIVDKKGGNNND